MKSLIVVSNYRILIILDSLELGGAERQALLLARYLRDNGNMVKVLGFQMPGRAADLCDEYGIPWRIVDRPCISTGYLERLNSILNFTRELAKEKPDIILSYLLHPNLVCGLTWWMSGAKLFIWNQRDAGLEHVPGRKIELLAAFFTPCFITNSNSGADFLHQDLRVQMRKINIVRNGIQLPAPLLDRSAWRQKLGVDSNILLACMVANLTDNKDHETLLNSWHLVIKKLRNINKTAKLLLAGRLDNTTDHVKALVLDLELYQDVQILGRVDDIAGLLSAVDLFVYSSRSEGCPNGVLEAMAAGLPVVATDIPGLRDALGPDALLSTPGNVKEFADQIFEFIQDERMRSTEGARNRQRVVNEFNLYNMFRLTEDIIDQQLNRKPWRLS